MAHNFQAQVGCPDSYMDLSRALHLKYTRNRDAFEAHVRQELKQRGVRFAGITYKEEGYRDSFFIRSLENGKTVNQTKLPVFI